MSEISQTLPSRSKVSLPSHAHNVLSFLANHVGFCIHPVSHHYSILANTWQNIFIHGMSKFSVLIIFDLILVSCQNSFILLYDLHEFTFACCCLVIFAFIVHHKPFAIVQNVANLACSSVVHLLS